MNMMIVQVDPGFSVGKGGSMEFLGLAAFVVVGLVLLIAAARLCRRHGKAPHAVHYTAPRL